MKRQTKTRLAVNNKNGRRRSRDDYAIDDRRVRLCAVARVDAVSLRGGERRLAHTRAHSRASTIAGNPRHRRRLQ